MAVNEVSLIAHLIRRAGFGARRHELEAFAVKSYEAVVEDLLHPGLFPDVDGDLMGRYYDEAGGRGYHGQWLYRMLNSKRPLLEKMALFCHHVFATGSQKVMHNYASIEQIEMFRRVGMSDIRTILVELSRDPAMIAWLDNNENHRVEPNENYGRELLELFSMGVGNYTEEDVKAVTHAFTGWTFKTPILGQKGTYPVDFVYKREDHDDRVKSFLGDAGPFNGEDIVEVIARQPATARFIARHLYTFFVADEPVVASWNEVPPREPEAIETLVKAYFESDGDMREILRTLFNSDFFKDSQFKRVKSPIELVTGVLKLKGTFTEPDPGLKQYSGVTANMGQKLLDPLTVEGWHTGHEWIDGGTLNERVNFAVNELSDAALPGVRSIIERLAFNGGTISPSEFVEKSLELAGPVAVGPEAREELLEYAEAEGPLDFDSPGGRAESEARVVRMLQLIVATREYQFN